MNTSIPAVNIIVVKISMAVTVMQVTVMSESSLLLSVEYSTDNGRLFSFF